MNKKILIYVFLGFAVLIGGIFVFSQYFHKQFTTNSTLGIDKQLSQDTLLGSIATSTDGKLMIYTNTKYKFSLSYPTDWILGSNSFGNGQMQLFKDTYYINNDTSSVFNYRYKYKIEMGVFKNSNQTTFDDGGDKLSTTTVVINGIRIERLDFSHYSGGKIGQEYIRTYILPLQSDLAYSLGISMYNFGTSTSDYTE